MATTFEGATRADVQRFAPDALGSIILGLNLRHDLGDVEALARSIAADGQLQPGVVRRDHEGRPVLVAGFRRLAAVKLINSNPTAYGSPAEVPFLAVFRKMNEGESLVINLRENLDRKELSPIDLGHAAVALERLGWERSRIAEAMRCSESQVSQFLALIELPAAVVGMVHHRELPVSAALAMRSLSRPRVDALVAALESGEAKPQTVIREAREVKRAAGKRLGRTLAELKARLVDLATGPATDLLAWIDGEIDEDVPARVLAERREHAE